MANLVVSSHALPPRNFHPSNPRCSPADAGILINRALTATSTTTRTSLSSRGVTYADGRLSVKTDKPAPSRQEYIANTQRAFEAGARTMSLHPDAFRHGPGDGAGVDSAGAGSGSGVEG